MTSLSRPTGRARVRPARPASAAMAPASSGMPVRARLMSSPPEHLGEDRRLGHATPVGPQDALADRIARRSHRNEGLARPGAGDDIDPAERRRRLGPRLGAGDDHRGPPAQRVLLGPAELGMGGGHARPGSVPPALRRSTDPTLVTVVPKSMVRIITGAPARPRARPFRPGRGPGRRRGRWPSRSPPPAMTSRTSSSTGAPAGVARADHRERGPARRRWPPRGPRPAGALAPAATAGTGTLMTGAPISCATTAANTMDSVSRATRPSRHDERLDQRLEPGRPGLLEHLPEQLERRRGPLVRHVDPRHVLDPGPSVGAGPWHAGHQAVVELEGRTGQAGAVQREVGAVRRGQRDRRRPDRPAAARWPGSRRRRGAPWTSAAT